MTQFVGPAINLKQRASQVAGFAALVIAASAFIIWWASAPLLSGGGLAAATVKPTTALCLAALGLALMDSSTDSRFVFAACLAVAAIAALDLLDHFGIDLGINRLNHMLVPQSAVPGPETLFHTINGVPVSLLPTAASLALSRFERHRFAATALSGVVGVIMMFALLNYLLSGSRVLYGTIDLPTPSTSIGLLCVVGAIILRIGTIPAFRKPRPLWLLLVVLGCAIITPLSLFSVYMGLHITDAELQDTQNHLRSEARALSADADREIVGEMKRLQALAASPSLRRGDLAEFQRQAEASLAVHQTGSVVLVDRNMQQLVNIWVPFGTPLEKTAVPEAVRRALTTGEPQITDLFTGSVSHELLFGIIVPVTIDGENRYVLERAVDQRVLAALVATHELPPGWHAVISDAVYRIIALSYQEDALIGTLLSEAQRRGAKSDGVFEFVDSEGRPSMEASVRSELTGWQTAVWAPTALLESRVRTLWWAISFASLLAFALVFGFALWLGRIVTRSVGQAARATVALKKGSPLPLSETPIAEFETLMEELRETAAELQETAAKRQAAEQDLQASRDQLQVSKDQLQLSKDRLQLAFDATELGWWQYDPCRFTMSVDARFKKIFDVSTDEISLEDLANRVHPDDAEGFRMNREAALDPANPKPYFHHEYRVRQRDGTVRWVESDGLAYFAGAGPARRLVSFGGTVRDITERKDREEKEHLLMREISHRAKNMLSVVDSIARQTAARSPEDFLARFSERVQALSANQDLLVRNEWRGVDVEDLVRAQLACFADLIGIRITLHGPKLCLNPASTQVIGLALHELASNAKKYGALSTDLGRVDIRWKMTDGDTFTMSWTEHEGPPVTAPKRQGFGSIVMQAMTERSVAGTVDLDYAPSGITWRLRCPATNAFETGWRTASEFRPRAP